MNPIKAIVFDLDGTLINTAPDVRLALNHMLKQYQLPSIIGDDVYDLIGLGALTMIEKAFTKFNMSLTADELVKARTCYLEFYREHPVIESYIYPQVKTVLTQLKQQGLQFGICTNKPSVMTHLVLEQFHLKDYFNVIVAGDDIKTPKPDGKHIHDVLQKMGSDNAHSIMVGDSDIDMACAVNAGIGFIGVTYGYSRKPIPTTVLINHFQELPNAIQLFGTTAS